MKSASPGQETDNLLQRIRHFCAYQERCSHEVEEKLRSWHVAPQKIRTILITLSDENFLDEERFARAFVRGKFNTHKWGRYKIKFELMSRKIPDRIIEMALTEIREDNYKNTLISLIIKKIKESGPQRLNLRDKIFTFASGKGYEPNLIHKILTELKI